MISKEFFKHNFMNGSIAKAINDYDCDDFMAMAGYIDADVYSMLREIVSEEGELLPAAREKWFEKWKAVGIMGEMVSQDADDSYILRDVFKPIADEVKVLALKKWIPTITIAQFDALCDLLGEDGAVCAHGAYISLWELYHRLRP